MKRKNIKRNALVTSILSLLLCVSMLVGTTFAWFTDEVVSGVNTIAAGAEMLYEYRSDSMRCLNVMEAQMREILLAHRSRDAKISVKRLGERPGMGEVDQEKQSMLEESACAALAHYAGVIPPLRSGSTDCNVPLSMGVPSVCFGVYRGEGAHTREEWIDPDSICGGMKAALSLLIYWFEQKKQ